MAAQETVIYHLALQNIGCRVAEQTIYFSVTPQTVDLCVVFHNVLLLAAPMHLPDSGFDIGIV